jgi:CubicO group peptidase (beta-lactamase class C family)
MKSCLLVPIVLLHTASVLPQARAADPFPESRIDSLIHHVKEDFFTPGIAVAVIRSGSVTLEKTYGFADMEANIPVSDTTGFNVGSISKMVTSWGIMKLVEGGRLGLDEPVGRYLHRWSLPHSKFDPDEITVRRLLSHTAGISLQSYPGFESPDSLPTLEESLAGSTNGAGAVFVKSAPGLAFNYSGGGFTILQLLVEEVTGQKFEDFMRDSVLIPLGMSRSSFAQEPDPLHRAIPYNGDGDRISDRRFRAVAAAGLQSTLTDMIRFAKAELGVPENTSLVTRESLALMQRPSPPAAHYGLGHQVRSYAGVVVVGHVGSNKGWTSHLELSPAMGDAIIILTNGNGGFFVHNALVCEWVARTLGAEWPEEFCLTVPSARFDFLRDDLDLMAQRGIAGEATVKSLGALVGAAEDAFSQGDFDATIARLEAFDVAASEGADKMVCDKLIHMSAAIIRELEQYHPR